jgi:pimeloyl-ACP methyl ester carboxylesterase
MKLFYKELGEGQPLMILHGLLGFSDNWITLAKKFSENYHVILPDLRNHGRSDHSEDFNYSVMVDDIRELISDLQLQNVFLTGHSMGGKVAMNFAVNHPELVGKLVVVDIGPRQYEIQHDKLIDALLAIDLKDHDTRKSVDAELQKKIPEFGIRQFLLKNLARDNGEGFKWKANLPVIREKLQNVGDQLESDSPYTHPSLFIYGSRSGYVKESDKAGIRESFPDARFTELPSGHWVHAEKPNEFYDAVSAFLQS